MLELVSVPPLSLEAYREHAGDDVIDDIRALAEPLRGARVLHVNATRFGGGVAEILPTLTALMRDAGLEAEWRIIPGDDAFFEVTKRIHNGLQGMPVGLDDAARQRFTEAGRRFAALYEGDYDFVVIHDPQPAPMRTFLPDAPGHWVWRCHIDLTGADLPTWDFIRPFVDRYDAAIFTMRSYAKSDLAVPNVAVIPPSIDPLSPKNLPLDPGLVRDVVHRFGIDADRPLILQVSRFDPWKDPIGVIDTYRAVKRDIPGVQLALLGSMATDDPEGWVIYKQVLRYAGMDEDVLIATNLDGVGALEINAFQAAADVVLQKSKREGFGLTVSEALWKRVPVVAGRVGGIPMQVDEEGGRLVTTTQEAVDACLELLGDEALRRRMGDAGHERVRRLFLSTRNVRDYLRLFRALRADDRSLVPNGSEFETAASPASA